MPTIGTFLILWMVRTLPNSQNEYVYIFFLNCGYKHMMMCLRPLKKYIKATKIYKIEGRKYWRPSIACRSAVLRERAKIGSKWRGCAQYGNKAP